MNLFSCKSRELPCVESFIPENYLGKWYEIARLPNRFERSLIKVSATYTDEGRGKIGVFNEGTDETNGQVKSIKGVAKIKGPGRLKVSFFRPFYAPYYIIALNENYSYALVGSPNRKYLWILARAPELDEKIITLLYSRAEFLGFPVDQMLRIKQ